MDTSYVNDLRFYVCDCGGFAEFPDSHQLVKSRISNGLLEIVPYINADFHHPWY